MSDTRIWREWLESQYLGELERIASQARNPRSADESEDAVQQVFLKFLMPGYRKKVQMAKDCLRSPEAYLSKSVRNQRLDEFKKCRTTAISKDIEDNGSDPREGANLVRLIQETRDLLEDRALLKQAGKDIRMLAKTLGNPRKTIEEDSRELERIRTQPDLEKWIDDLECSMEFHTRAARLLAVFATSTDACELSQEDRDVLEKCQTLGAQYVEKALVASRGARKNRPSKKVEAYASCLTEVVKFVRGIMGGARTLPSEAQKDALKRISAQMLLVALCDALAHRCLVKSESLGEVLKKIDRRAGRKRGASGREGHNPL